MTYRSACSISFATLAVLAAGVCTGQEAQPPHESGYCDYSPAAEPDSAAGLIIGADVLLPSQVGHDYGVHVRFNGTIGAVAPFETVRERYPDAALLDCRGEAVLSPGFVNAHEHPAYSYAYPDARLNPNYVHRDEWRFGLVGKAQLPSPTPYYYLPDGEETRSAALVAMELRHLLGGATTIAGSGGVPGVVRNVGLHERAGDIALYDFEADVSTFPFSYRALEDLAEECAGGPRRAFAPMDDDNLVFAAYVAHVGEGRAQNCAAKREVGRFLDSAQRVERRYSMVHGVATTPADYEVMREHDVTLVWSPRSNLALYGETIDLEAALAQQVRIALATDWSPSGSFNMREEVRCAVDVAAWAGVVLSDQSLWRMATADAAYALGLERHIGAIRAGRQADLVLVKSSGANPYRAMLAAGGEDTLATWIGGGAVLVSPSIAAFPSADCVSVAGAFPKACNLLQKFGWSGERFSVLAADAVALTDVRGQAPCRPSAAREP